MNTTLLVIGIVAGAVGVAYVVTKMLKDSYTSAFSTKDSQDFEPESTPVDYSTLKKDELLDLARSRGLKVNSRMNKQELVSVLVNG